MKTQKIKSEINFAVTNAFQLWIMFILIFATIFVLNCLIFDRTVLLCGCRTTRRYFSNETRSVDERETVARAECSLRLWRHVHLHIRNRIRPNTGIRYACAVNEVCQKIIELELSYIAKNRIPTRGYHLQHKDDMCILITVTDEMVEIHTFKVILQNQPYEGLFCDLICNSPLATVIFFDFRTQLIISKWKAT